MICEICKTELYGFFEPDQVLICNVCLLIKWELYGDDE